jgi:glycyl-tRNA synthetase beta chain
MSNDDFLIEVGCEELPPKSLRRLMDSMGLAFKSELQKAQLSFADIRPFATPRRLAVLVTGLAAAQPEQKIERRGPSVEAAFGPNGEPTKAAMGFARSCGVDDPRSLAQVQTEKGAWLVYRDVRAGESTLTLMPQIADAVMTALPIDRAMRWGVSRAEFVRPVHWITMLYGSDVVQGSLFGLAAGNETRGHRFMSTGTLGLTHASAYVEVLRAASVLVDFAERQNEIEKQIVALAVTEGATAIIDPDLLEEVTALVEWPRALCGHFDPAFLSVPGEALISAMKLHQRYFHMVDGDGQLLGKFITIANIDSKDPAAVIAGNERVIRPRLADAAFFYEQDGKSTLQEKAERLRHIVFQSSLGTYHDKTIRVSQLAGYLADRVGADSALAARAGLLSKSDLVSDMVGEFPELQGTMGGYYARRDGEPDEVAMAIADHYRPRQSGGSLPGSTIGMCVAAADKLDTLTGLFSIGQPPTGSRDPFALRRQAIGVIRICIEGKLPMDIRDCVAKAASQHAVNFDSTILVDYIFDRLATAYQEEGIPIDTFQSARFAHRKNDVLTDFDSRARAIQAFRKHARAESLVNANKRVANILKQKEIPGVINPALFQEAAEERLYNEVRRIDALLPDLKDYPQRLQVLAELEPTIGAYFDAVLVMHEDVAIMNNRLATVAAMRSLFLEVADLSMLQFHIES